jgi:hypothetical protein
LDFIVLEAFYNPGFCCALMHWKFIFVIYLQVAEVFLSFYLLQTFMSGLSRLKPGAIV